MSEFLQVLRKDKKLCLIANVYDFKATLNVTYSKKNCWPQFVWLQAAPASSALVLNALESQVRKHPPLVSAMTKSLQARGTAWFKSRGYYLLVLLPPASYLAFQILFFSFENCNNRNLKLWWYYRRLIVHIIQLAHTRTLG